MHEMMTPNWGRQASKRKESFRIEMEMGKCSVWNMWMPYCLGGSEEVVEQVFEVGVGDTAAFFGSLKGIERVS